MSDQAESIHNAQRKQMASSMPFDAPEIAESLHTRSRLDVPLNARRDGFEEASLNVSPSPAGADSSPFREAEFTQNRHSPFISRETSSSIWAPLIVSVALVAAVVTFLFLMGALGVEPNEQGSLILLGVDALLILALLGVVVRHLIRLRQAQKAGIAGARLHRRIVALFSLVAAVPTALVAGAGLLALERGLTPWFSGDLRRLVLNAEVISQNFQQQLCQNLGREMRLMAADLDRANTSGFFLGNRDGFKIFMTGRATALGFPYAEIFTEDGTLIERAEISAREFVMPKPSQEDFHFAQTEEPPCLFSREAIGGLIKLKSIGTDAYLMVGRGVDPRALEFPVTAKFGVEQYQLLEQRRNATQFGIALVFALLTLIGLLASVLLGLGFADRLIDPIRRLMQATEQVSAGNLYVQVPLTKIGKDLGPLGATFNNMTRVLRDQHNSLSAANALIDERRQFMEAVLASVPAGVISLDAQGRVTLTNPTARQMLALTKHDVIQQPLSHVVPEIAAFVEEARRGGQKLAQGEIILRRRDAERILSVRVTGEMGDGILVTLDDITDLVTAQRSSAWADVARRIAHEIKNPLTPIQLAAERIRRKFGHVIVDDRPIFDQCTDTIIRQVEDIKRMVDEFASFARMPKPQPKPEDVVKVLREVVFMMRVAHPNVAFEESFAAEELHANFDRRLIAQAVQNLLKNACESLSDSPAGLAGEGRISINVGLPEAGMVEINIIDNGKGFPKDNRQRLLEPYMTTREGGTGLGLPIVAKIFEDHGGRIELLDAPVDMSQPFSKSGARVRILFPAVTLAALDSALARPLAPVLSINPLLEEHS